MTGRQIVVTVISMLLLLVITCVVLYFSVPSVRAWANNIFGITTEQPDDNQKETQDAPVIEIVEVTGATITVTAFDNCLYSLDGEYWQSENIFVGLEPVTEYIIRAYFAETDTHYASGITIITATTDKGVRNAPTGVIYTSTHNTITITAPSGVEYSIDKGETWQDSSVFNGLSVLTKYTISVRYAETDTYYASPITEITAQTTKSPQYRTPNVVVTGVTSNSITLTAGDNIEYSIDYKTWQDGNVFYNLEPNTEYIMYARYKETDYYFASNTVSLRATTFTENESGLYSNYGIQLYSWEELENRFFTVENGILDINSDMDYVNNYLNANLVIDNSVSGIAESAFEGSALTSVTIPASVTTIGDNAFYGSTSLATVEFDANSQLTSIGEYAFGSCILLTNISLPNSVSYVGFQAFSGPALESINIPDSLTDTDNFVESVYAESVTVSANHTTLKSVDGVIFSKDGATLVLYPSLDERTSYTIPSGVTTIGYSAFRSNSNLTNLTIPDGVTTIEAYAFDNTNILEFNISASVISIDDYAFFGFYLMAINVAENNPMYKSIDGVLYNKDVTELLFVPNGLNSELIIPEGVISARTQALNGLSITSITIPSTLVDFGRFSDFISQCYDLVSITVAENNPAYKSVDGVLYSKDGTELICYPAQKPDAVFYVPETIVHVDDITGLSYNNLQAIIFQSAAPPLMHLTNVIPSDNPLVIYVPDAALEDYQAASWFKNHTDRIKPVSEFTA